MMNQAIKTARTRRQRGYAWEDTIVKRLRDNGWKAFRLGSPSIHLPDVIATKGNVMLAIEAKSGTTNTLVIKKEQIMRCINWIDAFDAYDTRNVIFAFKFLSKKWRSIDNYNRREIREYFKIWDKNLEVGKIICKYDGIILLDNNKINLRDYVIEYD